MTVKELAEKLDLTLYSGENVSGIKKVKGCFIGDLLSLAMSRVEEKNVWVTIQTNVNVVAVASLTDCSCIIVAEDFSPDNDAIEKAKSQDVVILSSPLSAYEIAKKLAELGI